MDSERHSDCRCAGSAVQARLDSRGPREPSAVAASTEGDGSYWFCDKVDGGHGPEFYGYERILTELPSLAPPQATGEEGKP